MQDAEEAAYWDRYDELTAKWEKTMAEKAEWLNPPLPNPGRITIDQPDGTSVSKLKKIADDELNGTGNEETADEVAADKEAVANSGS
jgi:hypothetical protein